MSRQPITRCLLLCNGDVLRDNRSNGQFSEERGEVLTVQETVHVLRIINASKELVRLAVVVDANL